MELHYPPKSPEGQHEIAVLGLASLLKVQAEYSLAWPHKLDDDLIVIQLKSLQQLGVSEKDIDEAFNLLVIELTQPCIADEAEDFLAGYAEDSGDNLL
jgi:hypothetical protein